MNRERILSFVGNKDMTIVDAMEKIDKNSKGVLFIVDSDEKLIGSLTDGDIRRWLLKTGDLNAIVIEAMTDSPISIYKEDKSNALQMMKNSSITAVPLLNHDNRLDDIMFLSEGENHTEPFKKKKLSDIPVVIMAGGKGTRLYPYTKILPKPLIPIGDTPIVERIINCFLEYDITQYYMTVNYKKEMIKSYFSEAHFRYKINYVEEDKPLGTGGSLKLISNEFDKPLFVTNCDALILADYAKIYEHHLQSGNEITMVASLKNSVIPYGVLHTKENGELESIEEKPKLSYFVNTGMYIINPDVIECIPHNQMFHMTHLVEALRREGRQVGIYPISEDSFLDMGEFNEMHRMEEKLKIVRE